MGFFRKLFGYLYFQTWRRGLWTPPDRRILVQNILKPLAKDPRFQKVLFIGVQDYCADYRDLFAEDQYFTLDPLPEMSRHGAKLHITDKACNLDRHFPENWFFDAIILNGVIGYGLDEHTEAEETLRICLQRLSPHGVIVIGLNLEKTAGVRFQDLECLKQAPANVWPPLGVSELRIPAPGFKNWSHSYYFFGAPAKEFSC